MKNGESGLICRSQIARATQNCSRPSSLRRARRTKAGRRQAFGAKPVEIHCARSTHGPPIAENEEPVTNPKKAGGRRLAGKCLCGAVHYAVADKFVYASANCHCSNCRRATGSGSAFKPFAGIERDKFTITKGEDGLMIFGDENGHDAHCKVCGSLLYSSSCATAPSSTSPWEPSLTIRRSARPSISSSVPRRRGSRSPMRPAAIRRACGRIGRAAASPARQDLARVHDVERIERPLDGAHDVDAVRRARARGSRSCPGRCRARRCRCRPWRWPAC